MGPSALLTIATVNTISDCPALVCQGSALCSCPAWPGQLMFQTGTDIIHLLLMLNVVSRISGDCKWTLHAAALKLIYQKSRLGAGEDASRGTMDYPGRLIEAASISQRVCVYQSSPGRGVL